MNSVISYRDRLGLSYDPSKYQAEIFEWVESGSGNVVVDACAGSGKCLGRGTPVLMFDGRVVPVETIVDGDLLMGPDSQPRRVLRTNVGYGPMFKVIPTKGEPWICNDVHVLTLAGTNRFKGQTIDIQLDEYHRRCASQSGFRPNWKLFMTGVDFVPRREPLPLDPYFLGLWIGDGTKEVVPGRGLTGVQISKPDPEVLACCEEIAMAWGVRVLKVNSYGCPTYRLGNPNGPGNRPGGNQLLNALRSVVGEQVTVPHEYLTASRADREALLAGWLDADGHYASGYYEIVQKRVDHADALEFLARSLGFRVSRSKKVVEGEVYQRLSILGDASHLPLRIPRKKALPRQQIKNVLVTGFSTEAIGDGDYFGFTLDGDGRFLLGDFTVTHNTTTSVDAIRFANVEALAVAFNREIADVLAERLKGTRAKATTAHAHGLGALRFYCYARIGLNGAVEIDVDKTESKYPKEFDAAAQALEARRASGKELIAQALEARRAGDERTAQALEARASAELTLCGRRVSEDQMAAIIEDGFPVSECVELAKLARLFLLDFDGDRYERGLDLLARRYDVDVDALLWPLVVLVVRNALRRGCTPPRAGKWLIDFTDMIWLPNVLGLRPKQYDLVLVDECQDISTAARRLLIASVRRGGRMMWVGDPRQSINGFAGADSDSFDAIIRETRAQVLPLSVCYRCPTSHLARAREWRSDIEARPGAPVGTIRQLERIDYVDEAASGDLVICRRTAPLIGLCFELIAAGTSAMVRGRADMSKGLIKLIKRASKRASKTEWHGEFIARLADIEAAEAEKVRARARDEVAAADAVEALGDRVECVRIIFKSSGANSAADLVAAVERIFADKTAAVTLSTVHRSKGLEADRVVILEHDRLMSTRATQKWQVRQEENLAYVAYTRAKAEIIEIPAPKRER
jgi:hypothetical protein